MFQNVQRVSPVARPILYFPSISRVKTRSNGLKPRIDRHIKTPTGRYGDEAFGKSRIQFRRPVQHQQITESSSYSDRKELVGRRKT
ncbi:hypothetical protein E2C01_092123 [Portunus trituberculatus]|uniref:Uncharacterized protein n=1 Tax=Portunus trituberculatus TaxID=210409 RepID=A0A5B7JWX7_PORTR|nr:hypothetical protein [Portunus trituberculatus]